MSDKTNILVPIRFPLTDDSARTLGAAGRLAHDHTPAHLHVLHVNLFQSNGTIKTEEFTRAMSAALDGVDASVTTRRGFLIEEVILEEAIHIDADIVVIGANQQTTWRRLLSRLLKTDPPIASFLHENTANDMEIVEVDTTAKTPIAEPV